MESTDSKWTPVAYAYEAALHCPTCTQTRFGYCATHDHVNTCSTVDREGNALWPVFTWDSDYLGEYCDDCREALD